MRTSVSRAVLLVGGEGTRLRPLTLRRPKALIPLLDRPLLAYELCLLARHGVTDVILAVGYRADALRAALGDGRRWGVRLTYVEDPTPLGTAGALRNVSAHLDGPFVAMNGDLVYDVDLRAVIEAHLDSDALVTFCLRQVKDIRRFGLIQCDKSGRVRAFKEKQEVDETGRNTVNSGLYVMDPRVLEHIPPAGPYSAEHQLFPSLLEAGAVLQGVLPPGAGYWADVGTIDGYLQTHRDLLDGAVPWVQPTVAAGADSGQCGVVPPVYLSQGVTIGPGACVGPHVSIGAECSIGPNARLYDCILWEGVTVGEGCCLSGVVIADNVAVPAGTIQDRGALVP